MKSLIDSLAGILHSRKFKDVPAFFQKKSTKVAAALTLAVIAAFASAPQARAVF